MLNIEILNNCMFDSDKIQTLWVGSSLVNGNSIQYPIEYQTISGSSDSIIKIEAWDKINDIITLGGQDIVLNKIVNLGDNLSFSEELVIDQNGKTYVKTLSFTIPSLTLFLINQLKKFVMSSNGQVNLAPTIAIAIDDNDNMLIIAHDKALFLDSTDFQIGDNNQVSLSYISSSYSRARNCALI
jgi:hypothetical protein